MLEPPCRAIGELGSESYAPHKRANDAANVYAVMLEERAIFGDRDRFYQVWRQIAETDHFAFGAFSSGDGADQFGSSQTRCSAPLPSRSVSQLIAFP